MSKSLLQKISEEYTGYRCPKCEGSEDVHFDSECYWWIGLKQLVCTNCDGYVFSVDDALEPEDKKNV